MWRSILAVVLLPSFAAAQSSGNEVPAAPTSEPPQATTLNTVKERGSAAGPTYESFTFHNAVRRGRREEVAIRLSAPGFVTSPRSPVSGIVPLTLELQPADGLTVSSFRYPKTQPQTVKFQAETVPVSWWPETFFKIRADETAALGLHTLQGKLTFQVIDYNGTGVGPVQQLDVRIPITVVEHDARVQKANWPETHLSVGMIVLIIVLLPVEIPLGLLIMAGCVVTPSSCPD
jgi:hypothetical protein